jgi:hypothetical protein
MKLKPILSLTLIFLSLGSYAQQAYTLKLRPVMGKTYTLVTTLSGAASMSVTMTMKAIKKAGDNFVFLARVTDMVADGKSGMSPMLKAMRLTMTEDPVGHLISTDVSGIDPKKAKQIKAQSGSGNFASFPAKPIKVGDAWSGEYTVSGANLKAIYKFVSVGLNHGKQVANLAVTVDESTSNATMKNPLKMAIELSTGMLVESNFTLGFGSQNVAVKIVRI